MGSDQRRRLNMILNIVFTILIVLAFYVQGLNTEWAPLANNVLLATIIILIVTFFIAPRILSYLRSR